MPLTQAEQQEANRRRVRAATSRQPQPLTAQLEPLPLILQPGQPAPQPETLPFVQQPGQPGPQFELLAQGADSSGVVRPAAAASDSGAATPQLKITPVAQPADSSGTTVAAASDSGAVKPDSSAAAKPAPPAKPAAKPAPPAKNNTPYRYQASEVTPELINSWYFGKKVTPGFTGAAGAVPPDFDFSKIDDTSLRGWIHDTDKEPTFFLYNPGLQDLSRKLHAEATKRWGANSFDAKNWLYGFGKKVANVTGPAFAGLADAATRVGDFFSNRETTPTYAGSPAPPAPAPASKPDAGTPGTSSPTDSPATPDEKAEQYSYAPDVVPGDIGHMMRAFREQESSGNYESKSDSSTASGAYGFIDRTWRNLTEKYGVGQEFDHAWQAPPAIQDEIMYRYLSDLSEDTGGDIRKIANVHYTGNSDGTMTQEQLDANKGFTADNYFERFSKHMDNTKDGQRADAASFKQKPFAANADATAVNARRAGVRGSGDRSKDTPAGGDAAASTNKIFDERIRFIQENYKSMVAFGEKLFGENSALEKRFHDLIDKVRKQKDPSEANPWAAALMGMINPQMADQYVQGRHAEVLKSFNDRMSRIQKYEEAILEKRYEHEMASRNFKAAAETTRQMQLNAVGQARSEHLTQEAENARKRESDRQNVLARIEGQKEIVLAKIKREFAVAGVTWTEEDRKQFMEFYKEISRMNDMGLARYATSEDVYNAAMARMLDFKGLTSLPSAGQTAGGAGGGSGEGDGLVDKAAGAKATMGARGAMTN